MNVANIAKVRLYHLTNYSKLTSLSYRNAQRNTQKLPYLLAKTTSNHVAARMFGVDHTQIGRWRTKEEDLRKARLTKRRVGSGALATYEIAEESLKKYIESTRKRTMCDTL